MAMVCLSHPLSHIISSKFKEMSPLPTYSQKLLNTVRSPKPHRLSETRTNYDDAFSFIFLIFFLILFFCLFFLLPTTAENQCFTPNSISVKNFECVFWGFLLVLGFMFLFVWDF